MQVGTRHMLNRLTLAYKQYRDRYNTETERAPWMVNTGTLLNSTGGFPDNTNNTRMLGSNTSE